MIDIDTYVDRLEEEIACQGVMAVDLRKFSPDEESWVGTPSERSAILVELMRVWMEHRWNAGEPVTVRDCLANFPSENFSNDEVRRLEFEEQRQRKCIESNTAFREQKIGSPSRYRSLDELPGTGEIWSNFELLDVLGNGAFAKVYLARQLGLAGRLVALKLTFRQTLESQWLASLQHSAIVPIYSTHQSNGVYGICMPFLGNTTLADILRETSSTTKDQKTASRRRNESTILSAIMQRHQRIDTLVESSLRSADTVGALPASRSSEDEQPSSSKPGPHASSSENSPAFQRLKHCTYEESVCWIGAQLADALAYAHACGVVHSDIKPANILLGSDGQPRLLDFNVSYDRASATVQSMLPLGGTLPYMSPEHRRSFEREESVDARSDIYSLGLVLFEMLAGHLPEQGRDPERPVNGNPRNSNRFVSPALAAIVARCLRHAPEERYQSAVSLNEDLTAQLHQLPLIHIAEPSIFERCTKWANRHPKLSSSFSIAIAAGLLIAFLVSGLVVRDIALQRADWTHRMDLLRERVPNSMAMLTSLDFVPELEAEVASDLQETFSLVCLKSKSKMVLDPHWSDGEGDSDLRQSLNQMIWLAKNRTWSVPMQLPQSSSAELEKRADALSLVHEHKFREAIDLLGQRLKQNPKDFVSMWLLGDSHHALQLFERAQQAYSVCIALQPNAPIAYYNRGMARLSSSQFLDAEQDYSRCIELAPSWHWARFNRAIALHKLGMFKDAIKELDTAVLAGFESVSLYRLRAELHSSIGNTSNATEDLVRALACKAWTEPHWIDRGLIQLESNPVLAASDFENAIKVNPKSIDGHQKLAFVYSELLQKPEKAILHCNQLVEIAPWHTTHQAARAVLYARAGKIDLAVQDLRSVEKAAPVEPMVMYQIACGFSLVAAKSPQDEPTTIEHSKSALHWFAMAVRVDASIATMSLSDPDFVWSRQQPAFSELLAAAKRLEIVP
ncbi:MAG: protein kinase [Pirellula sp.]